MELKARRESTLQRIISFSWQTSLGCSLISRDRDSSLLYAPLERQYYDRGSSARYSRINKHESRHLRRMMMGKAEERLTALGLRLPGPVKGPPGVVLPFRFVRILGKRAFISGHGPVNEDGSIALPLGK